MIRYLMLLTLGKCSVEYWICCGLEQSFVRILRRPFRCLFPIGLTAGPLGLSSFEPHHLQFLIGDPPALIPSPEPSTGLLGLIWLIWRTINYTHTYARAYTNPKACLMLRFLIDDNYVVHFNVCWNLLRSRTVTPIFSYGCPYRGKTYWG